MWLDRGWALAGECGASHFPHFLPDNFPPGKKHRGCQGLQF